jgi:hypothetical protein
MNQKYSQLLRVMNQKYSQLLRVMNQKYCNNRKKERVEKDLLLLQRQLDYQPSLSY